MIVLATNVLKADANRASFRLFDLSNIAFKPLIDLLLTLLLVFLYTLFVRFTCPTLPSISYLFARLLEPAFRLFAFLRGLFNARIR